MFKSCRNLVYCVRQLVTSVLNMCSVAWFIQWVKLNCNYQPYCYGVVGQQGIGFASQGYYCSFSRLVSFTGCQFISDISLTMLMETNAGLLINLILVDDYAQAEDKNGSFYQPNAGKCCKWLVD